MKRADEEAAKSAFDKWLSNILSIDRQWEDVPQTGEPPDYYLTLNFKRFAVEVTAITDYLDLASGVLSGPAITNSLFWFIEGIEAEALSLGILNGAYAVSADPIAHFAISKEIIISGILEYLRATRSREIAPELILYHKGRCKWSIQKFGLHKTYLGMVLGWGARWEGEIQDELRESIKHALGEKIIKLAKVEKPWVLLLFNAFPGGDDKIWIQAFAECRESDEFHSIARVGFMDTCLMLKSDKALWIKEMRD